MTVSRYIALLLVAVAMVSCISPAARIDPESQAWLSVHYDYPFHGEGADRVLHGRVGPGFEIHRVDREKRVAFVLLFPNGSEPQWRVLQHEEFARFMRDWNRIGLMGIDWGALAKAEHRVGKGAEEPIVLPPFDDRTLVVTIRENGQELTVSIYAPEFWAAELQEQQKGKTLRDALDLFSRVVGEISL